MKEVAEQPQGELTQERERKREGGIVKKDGRA